VLPVTGLAPDEPVTISSDGTKLTRGPADAKGTFKYTLNVGPDKGKQVLTAVGAAPGRTGQIKLKVVPAGQRRAAVVRTTSTPDRSAGAPAP